MNQRKLVLYIAATLDGYIATKDHNLDWLLSVDGEGDNGYSKFYDTVDTVLMGRITYDWIIDHEKGDFPYQGKECYVFSRTKKDMKQHVKFISEDIIEFTKELKQKEGNNIWLVGGGATLKAFIKENLIDEIIVTIAPHLLGNGIALFNENESEIKLSLKSVNRYNQFVELHYEVIHNE